jgi:ABC-2 type transport system ATP-binding protein
MDEAERCGRVGYLLLGHLLAIGTPDELRHAPGVTPQGTRRLVIIGDDIAELLERLRGQPTVRQATIFGQAIHALVDADRPLAELGLDEAHARPAEPSLEDVFVSLSRARLGGGD